MKASTVETGLACVKLSLLYFISTLSTNLVSACENNPPFLESLRESSFLTGVGTPLKCMIIPWIGVGGPPPRMLARHHQDDLHF